MTATFRAGALRAQDVQPMPTDVLIVPDDLQHGISIREFNGFREDILKIGAHKFSSLPA
jgi:hypothetical protein